MGCPKGSIFTLSTDVLSLDEIKEIQFVDKLSLNAHKKPSLDELEVILLSPILSSFSKSPAR